MDQGAAPDRDDDVDLALDRIDLRLGLGFHVRVARIAIERADCLKIFDELGAVEIVAALRTNELAERTTAAERFDLFSVDVALVDLELADFEARTLVNE